ncbi:MAG TPA: hypothetical protein DET40_24860 [Lentisphaeria bacterium]|nr:MAG: hypothetical protein A2X45_01145 [Lentisphaerae bacterium GWF2_50_93]HCE46792.1 hypothetical protein [Lentisphaeria bacterium]
MKNDMEDIELAGKIYWNDGTLSLKAKGVMGYLLFSRAKGGCVAKSRLLCASRDGSKSTMSAVNELIRRGYVRRCQGRRNGKFLEAIFIPVDMNTLPVEAYDEQPGN